MRRKELATLLVIASTSFLTPFMISAVNIALPSIAAEFHSDSILLSWVSTAYLLSAAMFLLPIGKLADIKGRKGVFVIGIITFTFFSFLSIFSPSIEILIIFRAFQGLGAAMIYGTSIAILTAVFPSTERGKVIGISVTATYLGLSIGPFVGGFLTQNFGWRSIFILIVLIGLIATAITVFQLEGEWIKVKEEKFDFIGSIIYGLMLIAFMYGISIFEPTDFLVSLASIIFSLFFLILLIFWESRVEFPVLEVKLFKNNRLFLISNSVTLLHYSATFAISFLLSLFLQCTKGLTPQDAGLVLLAQPLMMALFSPLSGWLSDKIEPRFVVSVGVAITGLGLILLSLCDELTPILSIFVILLLLGFGYSLFSSPNTNAIMSSIEKKHFGIAGATVGTMRLVGQVMSMALVMLIFSIYIGKTEITPSVSTLLVVSMKICFTIFAGLCFLAIFLSLIRGNVRIPQITSVEDENSF